MFNILSLKDFKLNKTRVALPKNEEKSQYGNLIILNTKDVLGCKKIISNPFINKLSVYNQIFRDMKYTFKVRGKSINKREARERLNDYKDYRESLDLKGIVIFNSNQGKNMYYDISRYNQLFFEATLKESHTMKYIDYIDILKNHILSQEFFKYYPTKVMIIDVENWVVPKVDSNKETSYDNPLNLIYFAMKKDIEKFKELGDIEIVVTSSNALFKFNPIRCDEKSFSEFKREVYKIEKSVITDEEDVQDKVIQTIDNPAPIVEPLSTDPKVSKAIVNATDKVAGNKDTVEDKVQTVVKDPELIEAIKQNVFEPVDIKSTSMSKRDQELREAQKKIKIDGTGESIQELMDRKASNVLIPVNDITGKVKTLNTNMTKVKFSNFAQVYNEQLYDKDIASIAYSMSNKSIPVYIRDVKKENTSDSLNLKETWTFSLEDEARRRHTLKFDVPIFMDGRYMFLNGNSKEFNNQRFLKPIVKTGPDTVQICTNYNKIFMTRYGENVEAKFEKFKQMVITDTKRFTYKRGNCSRLNAEYKTTIEYDTLAKTFSEITCKSDKDGKPIWKFVFNQIKLKEECMANPKLKPIYESAERDGQLIIGYFTNGIDILTMDPDTQMIIQGIRSTKKGVKESVNFQENSRIEEIDREIRILSGGTPGLTDAMSDKKKKERIEELETLKDNILASYSENKAPVIESSNQLDGINSPEDFNRILNTFDYGYIDSKGRPTTDGDFSDYKTISPKVFEEKHIGTCWDYVIFEWHFFNKYLTKTASDIKLYYIEADDGKYYPTHTWLSYKDNSGKICIFESAWFKYQGIVQFNSEKTMIDYYKKEFLKGVPNNKGYFITEYKCPTKFQMTPCEFMTYVRETGNVIEKHGSILKESVIPDIVSDEDRAELIKIEDEINLISGTKPGMKVRMSDKQAKNMITVLNGTRDKILLKYNVYTENFLAPVGEAMEGSIDVDETYEEGGIVNYILAMYAGSLDIKEFSQYKSGKRFMYTRCKVMKKNIPLIVFLAYCEGLSTVLRKAEIKYMFTDKRPRLEGMDLVNKGVIQFADGYLIYDKFPLEKSLLMNGLSVVDTKGMEFAEFDTKSIYLDVFDKLFGSRILSNALDNFYEWMIDAPTTEILEDLNYPTDFVGLLLAGNTLLADNNYKDEIDMANWRIRNNELVYAYAYKRIADAYTKYRMTSENKNPVKISIPRDAVIKDIMMSMIVEDVSELSPIVDVEKSHAVTDKGPSGTNLEQAYTQDRRSFHPSMKGVMAISTSPDANVGLVRELTMEPNITNARGYVKTQGESDLNDVNLFSAAEMLTPLGVTRDDPVRTAMASKQSKHIIPVENSSPVLMSNGADRVLPYHISSDFSIVAKDDGTVVERDEKNKMAIIEYKNLKGSLAVQVIDMSTRVVKNGAGGFYLTNTLNCDKLKKGYKFKKNDILAYNTRFFSNSKHYGTRMNIGTLVKVACMSSYANFEDGDLSTKKLSRKMGTEVCMAVDAVVGANSNVESIVKVGQNVNVGDPLIVYDQSSEDASFNKLLANIGADLKEEITGMGKTPIKAKYSGIIQDIKMFATVDLDEMSPSLKKIVGAYYANIKAKKSAIAKFRKGDSINDYTFREQDKKIETDDGKIMGTTVGEGVKIIFYIKYQDNLDVGDKLVHFAALKCINGEMIPEGQEPFTIGEPDEEISTTFAPGAILARMTPSVMTTMFGNKVIIGLKKKWLEMYMKDNPNFKPKDEMY